MKNIQYVGGIAGLVLGATFAALIALLFMISGQGYVPGSGNDPGRALAFAAASPMPYVIYALYVLFAVLLVLIVNALADRQSKVAPGRMRLAMVAAIIISSFMLGYAMLGLIGEPMLVNVYQQNPSTGTAAYLVVRAVSNALNTVGIFAAGWAILLSGMAALGRGGLGKPLAYLLIVSGLVSILAFVVPPFSLVAPLLYIVWGIWLGLVLLRRPTPSASPVLSRA